MSQYKILIVDDEPFNVDYLEQELEGSNYIIASAINGQNALDMVEADPPDLVLLDIMMPVMDGFETLRRLKANPSTRGIPVIVISASNDLQSIVKGIQIGAEDFLPKPFEPTLLHARVSSSLEKKRLLDLQHVYMKGLEREFDIAREIQLCFLPSELPNVAGWEFAAYFKAAHEVAGDFYDAFQLPDGNLIYVIGDVCGKGVGAALFMTLFRSLIRVTSTTDIYCYGHEKKPLSPVERLQHVVSFTNKYVVETHGEANMFASVFIGLINIQDGALYYANCGNESPLILRNGSVFKTLQPTGPVIGIIPDAEFSINEIKMEKGDLLLGYTDGIPDSKNAEDFFFGSAQLTATLNQVINNPIDLLQSIRSQLIEFTGLADQYDDITMLAVKNNMAPN